MNKLADNLMLLEKYKLKLAPYKIVYKIKPAFDVAEEIGYPVVLKISSDIHKKEVGGVVADIHNGLDLSNSWQKITRSLQKNGISEKEMIIQKQIQGTELIIGLKEDKIFGPVIMLGSGGSFAEVLKDVTFRACPISIKDATDMIHEIKSYALLKGVRGEQPANMHSLKDALFTLSRLHNKINFKEVDINPIIVNEHGAFITDARIIK